jgi:mevalonate kinase
MTGTGGGKLILAGEHAVVWGHAAVAIGVDRGTTVRLRRVTGPTRVRGGCDRRLAEALGVALPPDGFEVDVASDLPVGRGMGSSAALAVALVRARDGEPPEDELHRAALDLETVFHGNPSGLDVHMAIHGGAVRYRRGPPRETRPLAVPAQPWVVLDSGTAGDTRALVAAVAARRPDVDGLLADIGALADQVEGALHRPAALGPLLTEHHRLLARLGVSTPALNGLVAQALAAGALGAKLSGAGGGGVVVAVPDGSPEALLSRLAERGAAGFVTQAVTR